MNRVVFCLAFLITHMVCSGQVPGNIPLNGLQAYFGFNNEIRDESGNGVQFSNSGVLLGRGINGNGFIENYAVFNGEDEVATYLLAANPRLFMSKHYSYTLRLMLKQERKVGATKMYQGLVCLGALNWTWGPAYNLYLSGSDNTRIVSSHWTSDQRSRGDIATQAGTVALNRWIRALVVFDGKNMSFYVDGNLVGVKPVGVDYSNHNRFIIGANADNPDGRIMAGFNGFIDDFAFWDRALTDQEVSNVFNETRPIECSAYRRLTSREIDTRSESTWTSPALVNGKRYRITGSGTWTPNGGFSQADCEYEYFNPCTVRNPSGGIRLGMSLEAALSDDSKLKPIEVDIDCDSHTYHYDVVGDGRPLYVLFRDIVVADNSGLIEVTIDECITCSVSQPSDSILGYRTTETHQVVTYALRNKPELTYQWIATGGYLLGETTKHYCDVIWGYDKTGSVCCIVSDSTCTDTVCVDVAINNATTGGIAGDVPTEPTMSARPNPTSDMIDISSVDATNATSYTLVDVTGRVMQQVHGQRVRMSVEDVPSGVYHLVMKNAEGTVVAMQRVVVQK